MEFPNIRENYGSLSWLLYTNTYITLYIYIIPILCTITNDIFIYFYKTIL